MAIKMNSAFYISENTKVNDLLKHFPFLEDELIAYNSKFQTLKNPILKKTIGKFATLQRVASMVGIPLPELMEKIAEIIRENSGQEVTIDGATPIDIKTADLETMKGIILSLHAGEPFDEVKERFLELARKVSSKEIAVMEQQLIQEGLPVEEIKRLCTVHAQLFDPAISTRSSELNIKSGHPIHSYLLENRETRKRIDEIRGILHSVAEPVDAIRNSEEWGEITELISQLEQIEKHYVRKENQLFPLLEAKEFTGPTQVMWAVHDDIRGMLKDVKKALSDGDADALKSSLKLFLDEVEEMIHKEENILFPTSLELLSEQEWAEIKRGDDEIGYAFIIPGNEWQPSVEEQKSPERQELSEKLESSRDMPEKLLAMNVGGLTLEQLNLMMIHLPVELSFVDEEDKVRYYSNQKHKIFPRTPAVIGRSVQNCHPRRVFTW